MGRMAVAHPCHGAQALQHSPLVIPRGARRVCGREEGEGPALDFRYVWVPLAFRHKAPRARTSRRPKRVLSNRIFGEHSWPKKVKEKLPEPIIEKDGERAETLFRNRARARKAVPLRNATRHIEVTYVDRRTWKLVLI